MERKGQLFIDVEAQREAQAAAEAKKEAHTKELERTTMKFLLLCGTATLVSGVLLGGAGAISEHCGSKHDVVPVTKPKGDSTK